MKRILLALLAFLGLVAQTAPVQARSFASGGSAVSALVGTYGQVPAHAARFVVAHRPVVALPKLANESLAPLSLVFAVLVPAVQQGVDRARE
ncbi:MAG: hypothetical protein RLZZ136_47 [Pseudomonadota bacterium]